MVSNYLIWGLKPYRESLQATERRLDLKMGQGVKPENDRYRLRYIEALLTRHIVVLCVDVVCA